MRLQNGQQKTLQEKIELEEMNNLRVLINCQNEKEALLLMDQLNMKMNNDSNDLASFNKIVKESNLFGSLHQLLKSLREERDLLILSLFLIKISVDEEFQRYFLASDMIV